MALDTKKLRRTSEGCADGEKSYGIFHYKTDDAKAAIETNGYFDEAADRFTEGKGDILHVVASAGGTVALLTYVVTRTAGDIALTLATATAAA